MAMNYEFERHIKAAQEANNAQGVKALESLRSQFEVLSATGIVPVLQKEQSELGKTGSEISDLPSELSFPDLLKLFRTQYPLTQSQLSTRSDLDVSFISRLERGIYKTPKTASIMKICDGFGWTSEDPRAILLTEKAVEMRREARRKS